MAKINTDRLRRAASLLVAAFLGAAIWMLAVLTAGRYLTIGVSEHTFARLLKEFAGPVGILIAGAAFAVSLIHRNFSVRRDREQHLLEMSLGWIDKAVEVVEGAAGAADKGQLFYSPTTDLQLRSAAQLLEAAERSAATIQESEFRERYAIDASYASSRLLELFRFRGTGQFIDYRYYNAVQLGLLSKDDLSEYSRSNHNIAFYHNASVEVYEAFEGESSDLPLDEDQRKSFVDFGFFLDRLKEGGTPFGHPFIGAAIPLAAAETILRFAVREPASTELADIFKETAGGSKEHKSRVRFGMIGLHHVLYQSHYFGVEPSGKVFHERNQSGGVQFVAG